MIVWWSVWSCWDLWIQGRGFVAVQHRPSSASEIISVRNSRYHTISYNLLRSIIIRQTFAGLHQQKLTLYSPTSFSFHHVSECSGAHYYRRYHAQHPHITCAAETYMDVYGWMCMDMCSSLLIRHCNICVIVTFDKNFTLRGIFLIGSLRYTQFQINNWKWFCAFWCKYWLDYIIIYMFLYFGTKSIAIFL